MFVVNEHLAYSEACFDRPGRPSNQDLCIAADFDSKPSYFGKGLIRIVMDGMSNGSGKEAVDAAAPSLYLNLAGKLMSVSRELSLYVEKAMEDPFKTEQVIHDYLATRIRSVLLDSLRATNTILRYSPADKAYCTVSVAVVFHRCLYTANMGDSPIYLLDLADENAPLQPLFIADNQAGTKIARGEMTEEEALHSDYQNGLQRFLGYEPYDLLDDENIHFRVTKLPQSSLLLLGSDGALSQLLRRDMAEIIRSHLSDGLPAIRDALIEHVGRSGSDDDFTLTIDWIETD